MGLTTLDHYATGEPRVPVPDWRRVGLNGPGWLWSNNLAIVPVLDIHHHLGWADDDLVTAIADTARMSEFEVMDLRPYNRRKSA